MKHRTRSEVELELIWYYQDSPAALGLSAMPIEPQVGGKADNPGPGAAELKAVRRQRLIFHALMAVKAHHRDLLAICYQARRVDPELAAKWGPAAQPIARCEAKSNADCLTVQRLVRSAHDAYATARAKHDEEHAEAVRWAVDAGKAREAYGLASSRATRLRPTRAAALELAAWLESVGLAADTGAP